VLTIDPISNYGVRLDSQSALKLASCGRKGAVNGYMSEPFGVRLRWRLMKGLAA
jgi:hypothetical protein